MILCFDDFEFDLQRLELRRSGAPVRADPTVLRVLHALLQSPGQVVTKAELLARVWDRRAMSASILSVSITRLRKTLGHTPGTREFVLNVPGRGYRFVRSVTKREATTDTSSGGESIPPPAGPLIVGREAVTTRMQRLLASAGAGRGGVCMLTGEAGIGKTASAAQLAATAVASGIRVAWAYCQEIGETPPLWPFAQLVRALLRDASARDIAALAPELSALVPELATRSSRPPLRATSKHRMFEAVLDVLERRDTVLIIDDLHRADAASCELLRYWMDRLGQQRVLVVATLRSLRSRGARIVPDLSFVAGHVNCTCIALERLTPESVEAYVRRILPASDATLTHAIWAKSEGNPFFMLELVRQLADVARPAVELLRISDEALLLLAPRIAELEVAARGLLSVAAVIGRRFELRLLQSLSGQDLETLTEALEQAVACEALVVADDAGTAYAFGHELIRKLAYDQLTLSERRTWHLKLAETLLDRKAAGDVVSSATLAYHFHAALPHSDPRVTLNHCQSAASEASAMFAHADSVRHLQHALEALTMFDHPSPMLRLMLLFQRAVYARMAGIAGFEETILEAAEVARALRSGAHLIEVGLLLLIRPGFPTLPHARALLEEGLALLGEGEHTVRGAALARLATCGPLAFDAERSHAQVRQALALTGENALLHSYNAYSTAHYLSPAGEHASAISGVLERLCHAQPQVLRTAPAHHDLYGALAAHQAGRLDEASASLVRMRRRCREMGLWELDWHAERYQILARLQHVAVDDVATELRALHARARTEYVIGSELMSAFDAVVVLMEPWDRARLRSVFAYCPDDPPSVWSLKVHALAAAGLREEAASALHAVRPEALAALPNDRDHLGTLGALARAALALGARDYLLALYRLLQPNAERLAVHVSFLCLGPIAQLLGEVASALGEQADALAHFAVARAVAERLGLRALPAAARQSALALPCAGDLAERGGA